MHKFPGVTFHPWVGKLYGRHSRFGASLLVLGESHYGGTQDNRPDFTRIVVKRWGQEERNKFFTIIAKVLLGNPSWLSNEDRAEVWEHVSFYNLIQEILDGPRIRPTFRQWVQAQAPFNVVTETLKPDLILVLGLDLGEHLLCPPVSAELCVIRHPSAPNPQVGESIAAMKKALRRHRNPKK